MSTMLTESPVAVRHLQVYYDAEYSRRDGKGFCVECNNDAPVHRFADEHHAAIFVRGELRLLQSEALGECNITVPTAIQVHDSALPQLEACKKFLDSIEDVEMRVQLWKTLQSSLDHIGNIMANYPNEPASLAKDFAPLSFGWSAGNLVGGLIFHGDHDGHGSGGAPTFSVSLDNSTGWQLHT